MAVPRRILFLHSMAESHDFGRSSEMEAAQFLERSGWCVLARNYRFGHREIDLIAERDGITAFIEVKARRGDRYGHPLAAITGWKRREIEAVARHWIARHGRPGNIYRFDAIAVTEDPAAVRRIEHTPDAWRG
jgi:putative endonuclease